MQRLFIAIPLPRPLRKQLGRLRPKPAPKVRPVKVEQMHITLHFIGNAEPAPLIPALHEVAFGRFPLQLESPGFFGSPRRGGVLWLGGRPHATLVDLHQRLGEKLSSLGIGVDERDFVPHVTLARCKPGANSRVFDTHLRQSLPPLEPFWVDHFVLFSSTLTPEGSFYRAEAVYRSNDANPTAH